MRININTDAVVSMTNKLEKLRKSALPAAVCGTLNDAVYNVKTDTMLKSSRNNFINREKNFFKANSTYQKATGFNISSMAASVGFVSRGGSNHSVDDLEEQEHGGAIDKKSFIPTVFARKGKTHTGLVKTNARLSKINKIINVKDSVGKSQKEKFVIAASVAGRGGFVLRNDILFRIDTAPKSNLKSKKANFKATPLYSFKKGRNVKVNPTNFMQEASLNTQKKLDDFYIKQGERQLAKVWK
jgi:hypothetical protein